MSILVTFVLIYLAVTIAIGLYAAKFVHNTKDYLVAGRGLPLYMNVATVFATWFGAETVLSVSSTFVKDGLGGIPADPFGASFCLVFVALFFARAFYRMDLLTIGDFYKKRYGKGVEVLTSLAVTLSYLGWTSAQLTASGSSSTRSPRVRFRSTWGSSSAPSWCSSTRRTAACGRWRSPTSSSRSSSSSGSSTSCSSPRTWRAASARS
jgi:Na+/proline symporter